METRTNSAPILGRGMVARLVRGLLALSTVAALFLRWWANQRGQQAVVPGA